MKGDDADGLSPVGPALLAAADPALEDPEPCLFPAIPPGMPDGLTVRGGDEGGEANIDPTSRSVAGSGAGAVSQVSRRTSRPPSTFHPFPYSLSPKESNLSRPLKRG